MGAGMGFLDIVRGAEGVADQDLLRRARRGDRAAFAELWKRHHAAGVRMARAMTHLDADDIVAESFERILALVLEGKGPTGAFRPYLYTTIRHVAASHGRSRRETTVDDLEPLLEPGEAEDDHAISALDRSLTAQAFRSLPERWQTVLWYTEVEGLDPHEAAPLLGLSANATAALSFRAREGLRVAWLQAHVDAAREQGECRWATEHLAEHERHKLSTRDTERLAFHLMHCAHCAIISEEVHDVGGRLRSVLLPLTVGAGAALALEQAAGASDADVAGGMLDPGLGADTHAALPEHLAGMLSASGTGAAALLAKVTTGAVIVAAGTTGTVVTTMTAVDSLGAAETSNTVDDDSAGGEQAIDPRPGASAGPVLPESIPSLPIEPPSSDVDAGTVVGEVENLTEGIVDTITGGEAPSGHTAPGGIVGADIDLRLTGTATPGAHLSLQTAGQVYATTTVRSDGTFTLAATAVPGGLSSLDLVQTVDESFLAGLLPGGGLLGEITGNVDALIQQLVKPIRLGSNDSSMTIVLVQ